MVVLVELLDGKRRHEAAGEHTRSGVTRGLVCSVFNKETVNGYMQIIEADGNYKTLAEAKEAGAAVFAYGQFIQNIIDFLIVAFCIFMMIKGMNKLTKKKEEPKPAEPEAPKGPTQEELLAEIRDLQKKK